MTRHVRLRELLVGIEGLALLRSLHDGTDAAADQRLGEVRRLLDDDAFFVVEPTNEVEPRSGYASWSQTYDAAGNPIVALEEPVVQSLLGQVHPGRALDAACGSGRHSRHLADRGHEVLGIDLSPEMLRQAAAKVPEADFLEGDLREIPARDEEFDIAVCGLALGHVPDVVLAVGELARVLRPGGRLIVSMLHPFQVMLGWQARFPGPPGKRAFIREHPHTHAACLSAFRTAGLLVQRCVEPALDVDHVRAMRRPFRHIPEATIQAYVGLPGVLVWDLEKRRSAALGRP